MVFRRYLQQQQVLIEIERARVSKQNILGTQK